MSPEDKALESPTHKDTGRSTSRLATTTVVKRVSAISLIIFFNILTLLLILANVVLPYYDQISSYVKERQDDGLTAASELYCNYIEPYPFPASLIWYFEKLDKTDDDTKWITFAATFWYDPYEWVYEPPQLSRYLVGMYPPLVDSTTLEAVEWPLDITQLPQGVDYIGEEQYTDEDGNAFVVQVVYPVTQHFFIYDSMNGAARQACVYLDASDGSPVYYEWAIPIDEVVDDTTTRCIQATDEYQELDVDAGFDGDTLLLYEDLYFSRYVVMDEYNIIDLNQGERVNVLYAEYLAEDEDEDGLHNLYWWKTKNLDLYDKKSHLCIGASNKMAISRLVSRILDLTGYNINVILTLNYFIVLLWFRNKQPVKSRLPLLTLNAAAMFLVSFLVVAIRTTINGLLVSGHTSRNQGGGKKEKVLAPLNTLSLVALSVQEILAAFCMVIYSLHIARYYYLKYLYKIIGMKKDVQPNDFKIHRRLTSKIAFAIYSTAIFLVIIAVFIPLAATTYTFDYDSSDIVPIHILVYCIRTLVLLLVALCFIVDLAVNLKQIVIRGFGGISWFFTFSDPLYFRIEMLFFALVWLFIHPSFGMDMRTYYLILNPFITDPYAPYVPRAQIASQVLYQVYSNFYLNFLICGGLICLIQVIVLLRRRWSSPYMQLGSSSSSNEDGKDDGDAPILLELLNDKKGMRLMKEFCEREWSTENILCWEALRDYRNTMPATADKIKNIVNVYVRKGSNMEVNIPAKSRRILAESVGDDGEKATDGIPFEEVFSDLNKQVETNLSDTLSRLILTTEYEQYVKKRRIMQEAQDIYL